MNLEYFRVHTPKKIFLTGSLVILFFIPVLIAGAQVCQIEYDYSNYLYSLEIVSYDDPIRFGEKGSIIAQVGANTAVTVHFELKGSIPCDDLVLSSMECQVEQGKWEVEGTIDVPSEDELESASYLYYYVYVTLPEDDWSPKSWGLVQKVRMGEDDPNFIIPELPYGPIMGIIASFSAVILLKMSKPIKLARKKVLETPER